MIEVGNPDRPNIGPARLDTKCIVCWQRAPSLEKKKLVWAASDVHIKPLQSVRYLIYTSPRLITLPCYQDFICGAITKAKCIGYREYHCVVEIVAGAVGCA
jgi:hypothetical protein